MLKKFLLFIILLLTTCSQEGLERGVALKPQKIFSEITAGWGWHERPHAIRYVGAHDKTYLAWVDKDGGWWIGSFDHNTNEYVKTYLGSSGAGDDHNTPSILIRDSDKRIIVFYTGHIVSNWYWRISTNPEDISSFGEQKQSVDGAFTYTQPVELTDEGKIYLFTRNDQNRNSSAGRLWDIFVSTDDGETFQQHPTGLWYQTDTSVPYAEIWDNGKDTIWFSRSDWMGKDDSKGYTGSSKYRKYLTFAYYKGGAFYKADGTKIIDWSQLPITDRRQLDMVWDSDLYDHDIQVYAKDIATDKTTGDIAITFTTMNVTDEINHHWYARWDSAAQEWSKNFIVEAGDDMTDVTSQPAYEGGIAINHEDINEVVLGRELPLGSREWEIELWKTSDKGLSWTRTASITEGDANLPLKQWRPIIPINHHPEMKVLWIGGPKYVNYNDYETYLYRTNGIIEESQTEKVIKVNSKLDWNVGFGEQEIQYIPTVNIYTDTNLTTLWSGKFAISSQDNADAIVTDNVATLTLSNPNPTPVLWKSFGYGTDPLVSLDNITYSESVDVFLNGNESKQVYVKFTDLNSKNLTLTKKLRG